MNTSSGAPPDDKDVVSLSLYRARLARARRLRRGDELLDAPDPEEAIRALPRDEFYYILAERGFPEASEILLYGSPKQIQTALDFAIWERDRLAPHKAAVWMSALAEAPSERIYEWLRGIDVELLALLLRQRARFYNLGLEAAPEDPEGTYITTPDGSFLLDCRGDAEEVRITQRLINALYENDLEYARRILVALGAELDAELEEMAYRWRTGRMSDLGFHDYYTALEVYRPLDPSRVRIGEAAPLAEQYDAADSDALRAPLALADALTDESLLTRAVGRLHDKDELAALHAQLVLLSNRVLSAERVQPGDEARIQATLLRVRATLDLALEYLSRGKNEESAAQALRSVALVRMFRVGISLIGKVSQAARTLRKNEPFARAAIQAGVVAPAFSAGIFDAEDAEPLAVLAEARPLYPTVLDRHTTGQSSTAGPTRPFSSLADLARATQVIERAAASLSLLRVLSVTPESLAELLTSSAVGVRLADSVGPLADALDAGTLARTALALRLLDRPVPPLRGLEPDEVGRLAELGTQPAHDPVAPTLVERAMDLVRAALGGRPLSEAEATVATRWASSLVPLGPVLYTIAHSTPWATGTARPGPGTESKAGSRRRSAITRASGSSGKGTRRS